MHIEFTQLPDKLGICRGERTPRTTLSFRTSPQTGVGISIEFWAAHRHTVCSFCTVSRNSSTKSGTSNQGIATPVCALARNDREFDKCQFHNQLIKDNLYSNLSVSCVRHICGKEIRFPGMVFPVPFLEKVCYNSGRQNEKELTRCSRLPKFWPMSWGRNRSM